MLIYSRICVMMMINFMYPVFILYTVYIDMLCVVYMRKTSYMMCNHRCI